MRRITTIGLVALLLAAGCSSDDETGNENPRTTTAPAEAATTDGPTLGPLVSGTGSVVDGTFVWTDYVYDDRGADTEPGDHTDLDAAGGDATYGNGWRNEADLVQTQLAVNEDGALTVRSVLETLTDPTVPVVILLLDTDQDPSTGLADMGDAWTPPDPLGAEQAIVLRQDAGTLTDAEGEVQPLDVTVDPATNVVEATLPLEPGDETWDVFVAAATADAADHLTLTDLGLLGGEPEYRWQDDLQADLLAGDGSVRDAVQEVPFGQMAEGGTELADAASPGFHTYLYESDLELGEGVAPAPEDGLEYRGPYQPYLVWIPDESVVEGEPMTLFLHGLTQNHLGSVLSPDGAYLGTGRPLSEERYLLEQYARDGLDFAPHNLTVWPLARGEGLGYRGIAEQDSLDVLADAAERFAPDPDRIILSGGSMGGIGAFRLGALYPDRFSVVAPLIGLATEDVQPLLANMWDVPIRQINGLVDPLIPAEAATLTTDRLDQLELAYRAWMLDKRGHEAGGFVYDCVFASLPEFERVTDPPDVFYTVDASQFVSDPASGLDLTYDGAYWISGMAVADESALGTVEAHRIEGDGGAYEPVHIDRRGGSGADGGDLCGPNPDVQTDDTWRERAVERELIPAGVPQDAEVQVALTNLSAVTVDVEGVDLGSGDIVEVTSDTAADVTLTGLEPGTTVRVGADELTADEDGTATLTVPRGATTGTIG